MKYITILTTALLFNGFNFSHAEILNIELPEKYYGATPLDYFRANYEWASYKKRPPFEVPVGTTNLARGKKIPSSVKKPEYGKLSFLLEGNATYAEENIIGLPKGLQWIQIDLDKQYKIHRINLSHLHFTEAVVF